MTTNDLRVGRAARPRASSLLDDGERAAFLAEWEAVQTSIVRDPQRAAEDAERLVGAVADSVVRRIGEIVGSVRGLGEESSLSREEEACRRRMLRCREAFRLLIDS